MQVPSLGGDQLCCALPPDFNGTLPFVLPDSLQLLCRSLMAAYELTNLGFKEGVRVLKGGFTEWRKSGRHGLPALRLACYHLFAARSPVHTA